MIRHAKSINDKSKAHSVKSMSETFFQVTSGHSGSVYHVRLLDHGGATCDCDWAAKRHNILNCGCSHVVAVMAHIESENGRKVATFADYDQARKQHRPMLHIGDGLVLTTRKAG